MFNWSLFVWQVAQANSVIHWPVSLRWKNRLLLGLGPPVLGTVPAWVPAPGPPASGGRAVHWRSWLHSAYRRAHYWARLPGVVRPWELPLTSYSALFQPEPPAKVRYQFCYSQRYLGRSFEHLSSVPCFPIRLTLCCGLWDGGKIVSLDCIYSK